MHPRLKRSIDLLTILMLAVFIVASMNGTARRFAIKTYYRIGYDLFDYVDARRVVSGLDGWLFYKPQFWGGQCLSDEHFARALNRVDTLEGLAEGAGISMHFSVSPDKFSIYPERIHPRARAYVGCRAQNGARWRKLAPKRAPNLVDHTPALLAEKQARLRRGDDQLLYYRTDTHWNETIAPILVDRISALFAPALQARSDLQIELGGREYTDLRNGMLLLDQRERVPKSKKKIRRFSRASTDILIVRDSFYGEIERALKTAFPGAVIHHVLNDKQKYEAAIRGGKNRIVFNLVERDFFDTFADELVTPTMPAIVARNMDAAERCRFSVDEGRAEILSTVNVTANGKSYVATDVDPSIILKGRSTDLNCLRVRLTTRSPGAFDVYLPNRRGRERTQDFEPGRSFALKLEAGQHDLKFILPKDLESPVIRIAPTNVKSAFELADVRFGRLPAAELTTGQLKHTAQ